MKSYKTLSELPGSQYFRDVVVGRTEEPRQSQGIGSRPNAQATPEEEQSLFDQYAVPILRRLGMMSDDPEITAQTVVPQLQPNRFTRSTSMEAWSRLPPPPMTGSIEGVLNSVRQTREALRDAGERGPNMDEIRRRMNDEPDPVNAEGSTQGAGVEMVYADGQAANTTPAYDSGREDRTPTSIIEANTERNTSRTSFFRQVAEEAEGFHGNTPQVSNDDLDVQTGQTTYDIGYGHKITPSEFASGEIHGIQFIDSDGNYIPLTDEQIDQITTADFRIHEERAKDTWAGIFEEMSTPEKTYTWDSLDTPYQNVLTSLHYNVRRPGQFRQVVREAIRASEVVNDGTPEGMARERQAVANFAAELRRKNAGRNTAGMDNRVVKELYFAGLIDSLADVSSVLPFANADQAGIPATAEYGSNPNRRPSGSQD
jgi:hypothetical protein